MRVIGLTILSLFLLTFPGLSQTPFSGGEGDGYSSASLILGTVGTETLMSKEISVFPTITRPGGQITVSLATTFSVVEMYSLTGTRFEIEQINSFPQTLRIPDLPEGYYLLRISDHRGQLYHTRIIISRT